MRFLAVLLLSLPLLSPLAAQPNAKGKGGGNPVGKIEQVKPNFYMIPGAGANSEILVTGEGVLLVDGKLAGEANYNDLMTQIKSVTQQPIKTMIVTQHHADHTGNNDRFIAAGVPVLGHEELKNQAATYNSNPKPVAPNQTYTGREKDLKIGGQDVKIYHFGKGHTGGDSVVYFPAQKVVVVSDMVTPAGGAGPLADYAGGGSATEWRTVMAEILKLDFDAAIPGNGPVMTKADIQNYANKYNMFLDRALEQVKKGTPKDQLVAQIKVDDLGFTPRIPNVDAFYEDLSKLK